MTDLNLDLMNEEFDNYLKLLTKLPKMVGKKIGKSKKEFLLENAIELALRDFDCFVELYYESRQTKLLPKEDDYRLLINDTKSLLQESQIDPIVAWDLIKRDFKNLFEHVVRVVPNKHYHLLGMFPHQNNRTKIYRPVAST